MKVKVLFSKPKHDNLLSKIIRKFQKTQYSHVCIQYQDQETEQFIVTEAISWGIRRINIYDWSLLNDIVEEHVYNITKAQYLEMRKFENQNCHKRYGFMQLIGMGLSKVFNIKRNTFDDESRTYVCSEWTARIMTFWGYSFDKDMDLITPRDINELRDTKN